MHVHELNPRKTVIALSAFVIILIIGFLTTSKPLLTYQLDMNESVQALGREDALFYPWQLDGLIKNKTENIVLFDIRNNFDFGQGHIPGAENISANDFTLKQNVERLKKLEKLGVTVVLYGEDQLQANGPWMVFRQAGFGNIKILLGGYKYYFENKENLAATKEDDTFIKGLPRFNYEEKAAPENGSAADLSGEKKPVDVQRRQKSTPAAGGC